MVKRMIIALSGLGCGLLTAILALVWPSWGYSSTKIVWLIGEWTDSGMEPNWRSYVTGAILLGVAISHLLIYGKSPKKRLCILLGVGAVWGSISWLIGVFPILIGLWASASTIYAIQRFPHSQFLLVRDKKNTVPLLDNMSMELFASLFTGAAFSAGLRFGLGFSCSVFFAAAGLFVVGVCLGELFAWLWNQSSEEGRRSTSPIPEKNVQVQTKEGG